MIPPVQLAKWGIPWDSMTEQTIEKTSASEGYTGT